MAKLTVKDLFALKGKRQLTEVYVRNAKEAAACEAAGIDMLITSERSDTQAIRAAVSTLEIKLRIADQRLARHAHLVSDAFTLADIQFGHLRFRYYDIAITRAELPNLRRYYDDLCRRPAYREHVMVSYEALRE